ncbi:hypothetical protein T265_04234 [Opisthorchis viverrini]|uniref:Uncharacterized protein n=1 Tax=Opisthorchis viverrini TaxID=6198 RepID=A0A074ZT87_OPIVI|nr:hypothetical protein T265_04234 [Opisthorchis viverrini]KER29047.1 hypothetical protein T265_04234 [Opisthorchis viverrini]
MQRLKHNIPVFTGKPGIESATWVPRPPTCCSIRCGVTVKAVCPVSHLVVQTCRIFTEEANGPPPWIGFDVVSLEHNMRN